MTGPVLVTDRTARPSLAPVVTWMCPPATLCRTALSISSTPADGGAAGRRRGRRAGCRPGPAGPGGQSRRRRRPGRRWPGAPGRRGSHWPGPPSLVARVSSASMRCSCSALEASSSALTPCQVSRVRARLARVTWSSETAVRAGGLTPASPAPRNVATPDARRARARAVALIESVGDRVRLRR